MPGSDNDRDRDDWNRHWDEYSAAQSRNPAQHYRRRLAMRLLERNGAPRRLLDIGSGQGDFLRAARERWPGTELAGVELSQSGIEQTRAKVPDAVLQRRDLSLDGEPLPELVGWATHAVCSEVIEHVDDDAAFLRRAGPYLAPDAVLVVTVPGGRMTAFDRHTGHRRHYTPALLAETMRSAGLHVERSVGAGFPFFNLFRLLLIARGDKLVEDISAPRGEEPRFLARGAMAAFRPLFRLTLTRSPWGKQIIGVARVLHAPEIAHR